MVTTQTPPQRCDTRYFGPVDYDEQSVMLFPDGIPAFEQEQRFLAVRQPINEPLVFLQSLANPNLCFATLPALSACPGYRLSMAPEDLDALGLEMGRQPVIGRDVLCLGTPALEGGAAPTVNLLAPIGVDLPPPCGRQGIQTD